MRSIFSVIVFLFAIQSAALAQSGAGSQDSSASGHLRPRWGSYLIESFPSPAKASEDVTIQFYNHTDETLSCMVFDMNCRDMLVNPKLVLQPKDHVSAGLHTFTIHGYALSTGCYFVRLTTYTASGAENIVDNARFVIVK